MGPAGSGGRPQPDLDGARREPARRRTRTYAAIEVACLDIIGKAVDKPVCDVVGGRAREAAPFSAYLFYKHGGGGGLGDDAREDEYGECLTPESMVRQTHQMIAKYGFKEIKLKGGVLDPELEIETIKQLRAEFGPKFRCASIPTARGPWKLR